MSERLTPLYLMKLWGNRKAYALQRDDGSWQPVREPLTASLMAEHLKGDKTVGTYVVDKDIAKTLVFDVDADDMRVAEAKTQAIISVLYDIGIPALSIEFSGNKGLHTWVVLNNYAAASKLKHLGDTVVRLAGVGSVETFPKQSKVEDLGNLIKLPGGVHRLSGKRSYFLTPLPKPLPLTTFYKVLEALPKPPEPVYSNGTSDMECLENIIAGVSKGGRNRALFHLVTLMRRRNLPEALVRNSAMFCNDQFDPPLSISEVEDILRTSKNSGPTCRSLDDSLRCENCPVLAPKGKLYVRKNDLRSAIEGDKVVLEVGKAKGDKVLEVKHADGEGVVRLK